MALAGISVAASPEWSAVQTDSEHVTYTTTQTGSFTFDSLGEASITNGESFTLTMKFYAESNPFLQSNALSFLTAKAGSGSDIYDIAGNTDNQFRVYIRESDQTLHFNVNGGNGSWKYGHNTEGKSEFANYVWNIPAQNEISSETPVLIGLTFNYVSTGDNHFTISATADSQIQFDAFTEYNVVHSFNFSDLTNYTGSYTNAPSNLVTTVSITKAGKLVPEPTTATLSLLALAGLAARRRRK
ncbi:MAG: PEP-CTERM sorting domain-containing protein [Akkermansiaceae bacterium]|nr:PEP-CTERM sorting domain-containing protein [Akkermansiaceae bacterium]